jgi:hypothetical protein
MKALVSVRLSGNPREKKVCGCVWLALEPGPKAAPGGPMYPLCRARPSCRVGPMGRKHGDLWPSPDPKVGTGAFIFKGLELVAWGLGRTWRRKRSIAAPPEQRTVGPTASTDVVTNPDGPAPLWSCARVAEYLAVSKATVRRWERDATGFPASFRQQGTVRYDGPGVVAWATGRRVVPTRPEPGSIGPVVPVELLPEWMRPRRHSRNGAAA